ncbi:hypothetical protein GXW74_01575 [Roseomonas eburnea]|uniref:Uncharacterized protein n=1 Tax=Neoroseomonas eburnea TaxID=1346889 RepID=A0A9X9X624_9PROT|nr:hypothetical protein [Neoroseomonas eburnea]MBR0679160.1 hypothetical protein [Neoroseomonas eburnea]
MASNGSLRRRLAPLAMVAAFSNPGGPGLAPGRGDHHVSLRYVEGGCRILGPFATTRRAIAVANEARSHASSVIAFHDGEGYYVRVC